MAGREQDRIDPSEAYETPTVTYLGSAEEAAATITTVTI